MKKFNKRCVQCSVCGEFISVMRAKEEKGEYYCEGCYKLLKDALGREAASQDYSGVCIKEENK